MTKNKILIQFTLFKEIHIQQQGAVVYGNGRSVDFDSCMFNDISTSSGGSCFDLESSTLNLSSNCFTLCKNLNNGNGAFANIIRHTGTRLEISQFSSFRCADISNSGDSAIQTSSLELELIDSNFTSNQTPRGASSIRTDPVSGQKRFTIKRHIDVNAVAYTVFEIQNPVDISYSMIQNTTECNTIFDSTDLYLSYCVFVDQSKTFSVKAIKSSSKCYSDQERSQLKGTTDTFDISFNNIDFQRCQWNVGKCHKECVSLSGFLMGGKLALHLIGSMTLSE